MTMEHKAPKGELKVEASVGPPKYPILQFFNHEHLPPPLAIISQPLGDIARQMSSNLPNCAETSAGLRKLLEAKDCFVRAALSEN